MSQVPQGYLVLANSERRPATGASRFGQADSKEKLSVSIRVRPRPGAVPLDHTVVTAAPRSERKFLTREEYEEQHGAAQSDFDQVSAFAASKGLKVVEVSRARRTIVLSGTVEQMNEAFGVDLGLYQTTKAIYRGREGNVHIPANLSAVIESVNGLDARAVSQPLFRAAASPQGIGALTPPQVARLYNFPAISAAGQTIGILEFGGGYKTADIRNYFSNTVHLPAPTVSFVGVDGATNSPGADADTEVILDIDVAGSAAPGAKIVVYFAPNTVQGWVDAITTAIHDAANRPSVLSISWAGGESGWGSAIDTVSKALAEAAAVGVTVFVSSGDGGSGSPAEVLYPASDPWVTACGGTSVQDVSGSTFNQVVWGGSGGGVSNHFPLPNWQAWAGISPSVNPAGHVGRGVPDIAGNADPNSGYVLILNGASTGPWGGTSAVAPLYAGLVALLNANWGQPVGYLNYDLYSFAGPYVYRDIVTGNNGLYTSKPGWDACTGFGSVDGNAMAGAMWGVGLPPALESLNGKLYMAWKGLELDERIFYSTFNGTTWAAQTLIPNIATSSGVALTVFNGKLFMAWKGLHADQGIYFSQLSGSTWSPQQLVHGIGTSTGPRLATLNGKVYMAWKGVEGDQRLFWSSYNGSSWTPQQLIPGVAGSVGPALAVFNNVLFAAWKGQYGDQGIYYSTFNGSTWTPQKLIAGVGSSEGPSLAVYNGKLYAAWKGILGDQNLWWSTFDGRTWAPQRQIAGVASSVGPSLAVTGRNLLAAWKGSHGDPRIWYSQFNGASWTPQHVVAGVGTSPDVAAPGQREAVPEEAPIVALAE